MFEALDIRAKLKRRAQWSTTTAHRARERDTANRDQLTACAHVARLEFVSIYSSCADFVPECDVQAHERSITDQGHRALREVSAQRTSDP